MLYVICYMLYVICYFVYKTFMKREIVGAQNFVPLQRIMKQCVYFIIWGVCCKKKQVVSQGIVFCQELFVETRHALSLQICLYK